MRRIIARWLSSLSLLLTSRNYAARRFTPFATAAPPSRFFPVESAQLQSVAPVVDRATRQALRSFPRALWVLATGNFVNRFGSFVIPMLALHLEHLGFTADRIGYVLGAYGIGRLGSSLAGGVWTDRHGHRFVIAASMFGSAAGMLILGWLTDFHAILAMALYQGFASELFRPASAALIAELAPPEHRLTAFALNRLAVNAGFALGPAKQQKTARAVHADRLAAPAPAGADGKCRRRRSRCAVDLRLCP